MWRPPRALRRALGEAVARGAQAELLGGEIADGVAVHGQLRGAGGGDDVPAFRLELDQLLGADRLDLGHDEVGPVRLDRAAQGGAVEHRDDLGLRRRPAWPARPHSAPGDDVAPRRLAEMVNSRPSSPEPRSRILAVKVIGLAGTARLAEREEDKFDRRGVPGRAAHRRAAGQGQGGAGGGAGLAAGRLAHAFDAAMPDAAGAAGPARAAAAQSDAEARQGRLRAQPDRASARARAYRISARSISPSTWRGGSERACRAASSTIGSWSAPTRRCISPCSIAGSRARLPLRRAARA